MLTKRVQRIAEAKATACSAVEISRFKNRVFVAVSSPSTAMEVL